MIQKQLYGKKTKNFSGISKSFFDDYFINKDSAVAYQLGQITQYDTPKLLEEFGVKQAHSILCIH